MDKIPLQIKALIEFNTLENQIINEGYRAKTYSSKVNDPPCDTPETGCLTLRLVAR